MNCGSHKFSQLETAALCAVMLNFIFVNPGSQKSEIGAGIKCNVSDPTFKKIVLKPFYGLKSSNEALRRLEPVPVIWTDRDCTGGYLRRFQL